MRVRPPVAPVDPTEIDDVVWLDVDVARERLSRASDREPLDALVHAHAKDRLATHALVVARHARARKRSAWAGGEDDRPLTPAGYLQAATIVPILSAVLAVSAVGAVWLMIAARKRKKNRLAMYAENKAAAIRGMYLYAKHWRKLNAFAGEIPEEVEAIWLEAAYSDHEMTDAQRDEMRAFVETSARKAWKNLNWWQRFVVYFCRAL